MIIVDTREQQALWNHRMPNVLRLKLDEGDYTTTQLYGVAHAERKSSQDLYGSIIQGHARFRNEILRAKEKNIKLCVFVECSKEQFVSKRFPHGYKLKASPAILRKIVNTIQSKYDLNFVWCNGKEDMRHQMMRWFENETKQLNNGKTTKH